jgi:hypothetical protein
MTRFKVVRNRFQVLGIAKVIRETWSALILPYTDVPQAQNILDGLALFVVQLRFSKRSKDWICVYIIRYKGKFSIIKCAKY